MPHSFYLTIAIAAFIIWRGPKLFWLVFTKKMAFTPEPKPEPTVQIQFYGGPLDGIVEAVDQTSEFYVAPYLPKDEDGEIDTSEAKVVGHMGDRVYLQPSLAYYQQIMDSEYIYVRDITDDEVLKLGSGQTTWRPTIDND